MTEQQPAARIVPYGYVVDVLDLNTLRKDTPEEYVRQEIEKSLVREYQYSRSDMRAEFSIKIGSARKRADIVVFPEGEPHSQETVWAVVECKAADVPPSHRTEGIDQLRSYLAACPNAEFGMWTNGQERVCLHKVTGRRVT